MTKQDRAKEVAAPCTDFGWLAQSKFGAATKNSRSLEEQSQA